jgi:hypothetical protein
MLLRAGHTGIGSCERCHEHSGSVKDLPKRRYVKHSCHGAVSSALQRMPLCEFTAHVETGGVKKIKSKFSPVHTIRRVGGVKLRLHTFLMTRGHFTPAKESRYPLNRWLCGPHSRSERFRVPLPVFEPRTIQPVAQSVYRLQFPGFPKLLSQDYFVHRRDIPSGTGAHFGLLPGGSGG